MGKSRNAWWVVVGSVLGLIVGNGPVVQFTFGVFVKPVSEALGTQRGTLSAALMLALLLTAVATPWVGKLVDRHGIRRVTLRMIVLFALSVAAVGLLAQSVATFILLYALVGATAVAQTPLAYSKAVAATFEERRGLALGVSIAGVGIGTALLPPFCQLLIEQFGWRSAYIGLGALTLLLAWPAMAFLVAPAAAAGGAGPRAGDVAASAEGLPGRQAVRSGTFWKLAIAFFLVALAASGVTAHIVPMATDRGVSASAAASALTAAGAALMVGRLLAGYLIDRYFAPYVAVAFFLMPLVGIALLLGTTDGRLAIPAAVLVGMGLGAEVDLIAYLQSRYFGLRAFGEIYGYLFAVFLVGGAVGPFLMGMSFQVLHSYAPALWLSLGGLAAACLLVVGLGPYTYAPGRAVLRRKGI